MSLTSRDGRPAPLESMGALLLSGPDARSFLQGQVSADVASLGSEEARLASLNSPQGRVQAVLWLVHRNDGLALLLPASLVESATARLRKYVLRSKVTLDPAPSHLKVAAVPLVEAPGEIRDLPERAHREIAGVSYIRLPGVDFVLALGGPVRESAAGESLDAQWRLSCIRAGLPQVYPQTHEAFVAQMLNLDLLGGISFQKGCYTGQEIIARTHYRGAIKRRMVRFKADCAPPAPGTRVLVGAQHAGDVVDAVASEGGCELLAVVSLTHVSEPLTIDGTGALLERLPLPYSIEGS
ncbi:MAG TPA: hypothetical protein VF193_09745 [Steroidobacter sp.]